MAKQPKGVGLDLLPEAIIRKICVAASTPVTTLLTAPHPLHNGSLQSWKILESEAMLFNCASLACVLSTPAPWRSQ